MSAASAQPLAASARDAGLRYVSDDTPGITRRRSGAGFTYRDARGRTVRNRRALARIRAMAIPPAWRDVWICPLAHGHVQATGRDARGRKQYRYHPRWTATRDEAKYDRLLAFGRALPAMRRRTRTDLAGAPLSRVRVLATVVRLLETTLIRIGNDEYARTNGSYGLTTMRDRHVQVRGSTIRFRFRAKSGALQTIDLADPVLARSVKRCQELPGQMLFQYLDAEGARQSVDSADVNQYLGDLTGEDFTAKDFRTWAGTVLAACALSRLPAAQSVTLRKRRVVEAIDHVAGCLGNTRAVCRRCYVHPAVLDAYLGGTTISTLADNARTMAADGRGRLSPAEKAVLSLLRRRQPRSSAAGALSPRSASGASLHATV